MKKRVLIVLFVLLACCALAQELNPPYAVNGRRLRLDCEVAARSVS